MPESPPILELRSLPTQKRSRQTFERILIETGVLLEEVGFDAFNTNLLSSRSGIGVRAIYRYFPNKFSLVCELARRIEGQWRDALDKFYVKHKSVPWPDIWPLYLDAYIAAVRKTPGGTVILQAMRSHPELRAVDDEMTSIYKSGVAQTLLDNHRTLSLADASSIASVLMYTTIAVVDASLGEKPAVAEQLISHLKSMHMSFLCNHLAKRTM